MSSVDREKNGFSINLQEDSRRFRERARILVAADGATASIRRGSKKQTGAYIAIQEWVESTRHRPYFTSIFDAEITDFYCWTIPKGPYLIIGAALQMGGQAKHKFSRYKKKLQRCGFEFGKAIRREGAVIVRPSRCSQLVAAEKGMAFIGEAGGWISPSSAEGLSYAFRSAHYLAQSLSADLAGFERRYIRSMRKLQRNIFMKNLKSRVIFNPFLRRAVMGTGLRAIRMADGSG